MDVGETFKQHIHYFFLYVFIFWFRTKYINHMLIHIQYSRRNLDVVSKPKTAFNFIGFTS
jgi:hypothetical protein